MALSHSGCVFLGIGGEELRDLIGHAYDIVILHVAPGRWEW